MRVKEKTFGYKDAFFAGRSYPFGKRDLCVLLDDLGYVYSLHEHVPVFTVEESRGVTGHFSGGHTKNLFLYDKKKSYWLVTALETTKIDLKALKLRLGASGGLSFVGEEVLYEKLGVKPGAVTPLSAVNNHAGDVTSVLDMGLFRHEIVNVHPLENDATVAMKPCDLLNFLRFLERRVKVIVFR